LTVLVLTERTEHLDAIRTALDGHEPAPFVLHGRMSKKQRGSLIAQLDTLPPDAPRILLATGKLVGEGFDHPPLDTLARRQASSSTRRPPTLMERWAASSISANRRTSGACWSRP